MSGTSGDRVRAHPAHAGARRDAGAPVRSPEVTAAVALLAGVGAAALAGPAIAAAGGELLTGYLARVASAGREAGLPVLPPEALRHALRLAAPLVAAGFAGALAGHFVQNGVPVTLRSVAPRWRRITPSWTRVGRRLWSPDTAFNVVRELLKAGAVAVIAVLNVGVALGAMAVAPTTAAAAAAALSAALRLALQAAAALLLLAAADYLFRFLRVRRRSHRSVAEEREQRRLREGDPAVRDRLRARMRELLARTAADRVAAADVVIVDAARAAVALRWDRLTMAAPVVVAKAAAGGVQQALAAARSGGVAVVDSAALAGALFRQGTLGDAIPRSYEPPVAAIMAAARAAGQAARGGRPSGGAR